MCVCVCVCVCVCNTLPGTKGEGKSRHKEMIRKKDQSRQAAKTFRLHRNSQKQVTP